jgi:hypothetical protein
MNELIGDAQHLAADLRMSETAADRYLLDALIPFLRTLEAEGRPQLGSIDALSRHSVECLEWESPMFVGVADLVDRARLML